MRPTAGSGSVILVNNEKFQDIRITCTATLGSAGNNAGIVFGYVDNQNFFVRIYSNAQNKRLLYEVSSGTWTLRKSNNFTITNDVAFTMKAEVRTGLAHNYAATVPAGQIGLWSSHATAHSFDDFKVLDTAGPYEIDGLWFCERGEVRVDNANNNVLETYGSHTLYRPIVRRGSRADEYVATYNFKWD